MSRLMDNVISPQLRNEGFIYLDDVLVVSADFERHLDVLKEVANNLRRENLTINGGIRTDPEKISAIKNFPVPKKIKTFRSFLSLCGW